LEGGQKRDFNREGLLDTIRIMLTILKTNDGFIYALIEWEQIDEHKILIKYSWVHDNYRNNGAVPSMVKIMCQDKTLHNTQFVGWERGDKQKKFKWYPLHRILRRI
jgi:hypothetical protein